MSNADQNNQPLFSGSGDHPDVCTGPGAVGTPLKKGPRAPNLSTKETLISSQEKQERKLNDYHADEPRMGCMTIEKPQVGLNVTAAEFVPGKAYVLSADATDFVPQRQAVIPENEYTQTYPGEECYLPDDMGNLSLEEYYCEPEIDLLERFRQVLYDLVLNPSVMEMYLKPLCMDIREIKDSTAVINDISEMLLDQSIMEDNFRYTGARICQFLDNNLNINFAKTFITRCGKEFDKRNELLHGSEEDKKKVCGLAIFMAELFLNVQTTTKDGTSVRFEFMPSKLTLMIKTLLTAPDNMTVKCVCQLLKLVGGLVEDFMKLNAQHCVEFESIFQELSKLLDSSLSKDIKDRIQSVIELKDKNWSRSASPPKKATNMKSNEVSFQPVFYSDGKECPQSNPIGKNPYVLNDEEELAFLEWQAEQEGTPLQWNDTGYESYQYADEFSEMGEDMEAAYEEFLQSQPFKGQSQKETGGKSQHQQNKAQQPNTPPSHQYNSYSHASDSTIYPPQGASRFSDSKPAEGYSGYGQPYYEPSVPSHMQYSQYSYHQQQPKHHHQQQQQQQFQQQPNQQQHQMHQQMPQQHHQLHQQQQHQQHQMHHQQHQHQFQQQQHHQQLPQQQQQQHQHPRPPHMQPQAYDASYQHHHPTNNFQPHR